MSTEPVRMCDSCGGVDDHPHHVHGTAPGDAPTASNIVALAVQNAGPHQEAILRHIQDTATVMKHLDCCAADGCPTGTCPETVAKAGGKQGSALRTFIKKGGK